jgi:hypothetical protein
VAADGGNEVALVGFWIAASGAFMLYMSVDAFESAVAAPLSLLLGLAGAICAWVGRRRIKRGQTIRHSMWADVGLAVGAACVVLSLIAVVVLVVSLAD